MVAGVALGAVSAAMAVGTPMEANSAASVTTAANLRLDRRMVFVTSYRVLGDNRKDFSCKYLIPLPLQKIMIMPMYYYAATAYAELSIDNK